MTRSRRWDRVSITCEGVDRPIGMFDSGFGGLTVARAVIDLMPGEDLVYIGDTGRYPYGPKPHDEVRGYAAELARSLVTDHRVKAVIVACNTATAAGLDDIRAELPVPVLEHVVIPGAISLVDATVTGRIGVIGTVGTVSSGAYVNAVEVAKPRTADREVELTSAACPGFVEFVDRGQTSGDEVTVLGERLLAPIVAAKVDALLLGCTHYPYLARVISDVVGPDVTLVSSADETAFAVLHTLGGLGLLRPPVRHRRHAPLPVERRRRLVRRARRPLPRARAAAPPNPGPPATPPATGHGRLPHREDTNNE